MTPIILFRKFVGIFITVLSCIKSIIQKLICKRKRKASNVLPFTNPMNSKMSLPSNEIQLQPWETWEENKQRTIRPTVFSKLEEPTPIIPDYFADMQPEVKNATILIKKKEQESVLSSRLSINANISTNEDSQLGNWDEYKSDENAWNDSDLLTETDLALKEQKRIERHRRNEEQLRKKAEREVKRSQCKI